MEDSEGFFVEMASYTSKELDTFNNDEQDNLFEAFLEANTTIKQKGANIDQTVDLFEKWVVRYDI